MLNFRKSSCFTENPMRLSTAHGLEATGLLSAHPYLSLKYERSAPANCHRIFYYFKITEFVL